jgi:hypothetical protein
MLHLHLSSACTAYYANATNIFDARNVTDDSTDDYHLEILPMMGSLPDTLQYFLLDQDGNPNACALSSNRLQKMRTRNGRNIFLILWRFPSSQVKVDRETVDLVISAPRFFSYYS